MKRVALILGLLVSAAASGASTPGFVTLRNWKIPVATEAKVVLGRRANARIAYVSIGGDKFTLVWKDAAPQSIRSIRNRIRELKGDPGSLKALPRERVGSVFMFTGAESIHWFSTLGGHVVLTASQAQLPALKRALEGKVTVR